MSTFKFTFDYLSSFFLQKLSSFEVDQDFPEVRALREGYLCVHGGEVMVSQLESGGLPRDGDPGKWGGAHTDVHGGFPVVMLSICVLSHLSPKVFSSRRGVFFFFFFYQIHVPNTS